MGPAHRDSKDRVASAPQDDRIGEVDPGDFLSDSFLTFLASAFPLTPEDIDLWQDDQEKSPTDIIDWLVDTGRIDMRIGHVLLEFRGKAIGPQEARAAIEVIQEDLNRANRLINEAAETSAGPGRQSRFLTASEAATEGDEFSSSNPMSTPLPFAIPPVSPNANPAKAQSSGADPYSKTEVAIMTPNPMEAEPPPPVESRTPNDTRARRDFGEYEHLYGQNFGKYLICTGIGRGSMGAIVLAHHRLLGIPVAIKLLSPALARDDGFRGRFFSEGRFAANIQHPALVHVFDCDERDDWLYLVMEYVDGMSGLELIRTAGHLPELQALRMIRRVAEGLAEAHRHGVIHRDVKPGNLLLGKNGHVKLTDLGLARTLTPSDQVDESQIGNVVGTPLYMAPEQSGPEGTYDHRADIYALGGTLYHILGGIPPFNAKTLASLLRQHAELPVPQLARHGVHVTPRTSALVSWMLAKDPAERPANCEELIAEVDACIESASRSRGTAVTNSAIAKPRRPTTNFDPLGLGQRLSAILQGSGSQREIQ